MKNLPNVQRKQRSLVKLLIQDFSFSNVVYDQPTSKTRGQQQSILLLSSPNDSSQSQSKNHHKFTTITRIIKPCQHWQWHWKIILEHQRRVAESFLYTPSWRMKRKAFDVARGKIRTFPNFDFTQKAFRSWMEMCFPQLLLEFNKVPTPSPPTKQQHHTQCVHRSPQKWSNILNTFLAFWWRWLDCFSHNFPTHLRESFSLVFHFRPSPNSFGIKLQQSDADDDDTGDPRSISNLSNYA